MAWMHPPVHRLLGWVSRPSALRSSRDVWRLDQCRGFDDQQVFVKGDPAEADQITLDRLPTLVDADLLNADGERVGIIADLAFLPASGQISHYLVQGVILACLEAVAGACCQIESLTNSRAWCRRLSMNLMIYLSLGPVFVRIFFSAQGSGGNSCSSSEIVLVSAWRVG